MTEKILIIDDEETNVKLLTILLEHKGFEVVKAYRAEDGLRKAYRNQPDLVLLDIMMPDMDGWEVCRRLRELSDMPIVFLTAKTDTKDIVKGLEMGADDYIVKPFSVRELLARVRAVLRRSNPDAEEEDVIRRGHLILDIPHHEVTWGSQKINLTATEFRILEFLVTRPNRVNSRDDIINGALDRDESIYDRTIDVHITALRKKLGGGAKHVLTVRGFGYKWSESGEE